MTAPTRTPAEEALYADVATLARLDRIVGELTSENPGRKVKLWKSLCIKQV